MQRACLASRTRSVRVQSLHKALRQQTRPLSAPDDFTFEALTRLRRPDVDSFLQLAVPRQQADDDLPESSRRDAWSVRVGGTVVHEAGPLAGLHYLLDTAARRVLPGHLLRRCRILSSVQLGSVCLQRVALTASTGEESIFSWRLLAADSVTDVSLGALRNLQQDHSVPQWLVASVSRDDSADAQDLPTKPHPRLAPEVVIMAQLAALQRGDIATAAAFSQPSPSLAWQDQLLAFRSMLRQQPAHHLLLTHSKWELQASALPTQRTFVAEVLLHPQRSSALPDLGIDEVAGSRRFVWELGLPTSGGCWYVQSMRPV